MSTAREYHEAMRSTSLSWDANARTLDEAKFTVWSVPPDTYDATTTTNLNNLCAYVPDSHGRMLDLGCGIGRLTIPMAHIFPEAKVIGVDISRNMLAHAKSQARISNTRNVSFVRSTEFPNLSPISFAWEIVMFQHTYPENCALMVEWVAGMLEPGGVFMYQVVENVDFTDWGHLPREVPVKWATDAGLEIVELKGEPTFPDWLWVITRKPL